MLCKPQDKWPRWFVQITEAARHIANNVKLLNITEAADTIEESDKRPDKAVAFIVPRIQRSGHEPGAGFWECFNENSGFMNDKNFLG